MRSLRLETTTPSLRPDLPHPRLHGRRLHLQAHLFLGDSLPLSFFISSPLSIFLLLPFVSVGSFICPRAHLSVIVLCYIFKHTLFGIQDPPVCTSAPEGRGGIFTLLLGSRWPV